MADEGHNYSFGAPKCGWPEFGADGRRQRCEFCGSTEHVVSADGAKYGGMVVETAPCVPRDTWYMVQPASMRYEKVPE